MRITLPLLAALLFATAASAFEIRTIREQIPESNPVIRTILTEGPTRLSYIAPLGWAAVARSEKRIVYRSSDEKGTLQITLSTNAAPASAQILRDNITQAFQDATVIDEFKTANGNGPGFGIEFETRGLTRRLSVFPAPAGSVEIVLYASSRLFADYHPHWTGFLNSFRIEKNQ